MYDSLPKKEKTFQLDIVGSDTGLPYKGEFTVLSVLDMAGKHGLELEKTRLMADYANPSRGLAGISITLATIRARIIKAPDWWDELDQGSQILDENVILNLYDHIMSAEEEWKSKLKKAVKESETAAKKEEEAEGK